MPTFLRHVLWISPKTQLARMNTLHNVSCPSFPYTRLAIFTFLRKVHYIFTFFFFSRAVPANINEKVRKTVFFGLFKVSTKFDALKTYSGVFKNTPE